MKLLGIDYGQKRVGLAISSGTLVFPYKTLVRTTRDKLFADLLDICDAENVTDIVLGLPLYLDGEESLTTRQVRNFRASLARRTDRPIHLVNEVLTSFDARSRLREAGVSARKSDGLLDQMAAVCILETFLREQGTTCNHGING
jgi:putative Holliday junction resolvase